MSISPRSALKLAASAVSTSLKATSPRRIQTAAVPKPSGASISSARALFQQLDKDAQKDLKRDLKGYLKKIPEEQPLRSLPKFPADKNTRSEIMGDVQNYLDREEDGDASPRAHSPLSQTSQGSSTDSSSAPAVSRISRFFSSSKLPKEALQEMRSAVQPAYEKAANLSSFIRLRTAYIKVRIGSTDTTMIFPSNEANDPVKWAQETIQSIDRQNKDLEKTMKSLSSEQLKYLNGYSKTPSALPAEIAKAKEKLSYVKKLAKGEIKDGKIIPFDTIKWVIARNLLNERFM